VLHTQLHCKCKNLPRRIITKSHNFSFNVSQVHRVACIVNVVRETPFETIGLHQLRPDLSTNLEDTKQRLKTNWTHINCIDGTPASKLLNNSCSPQPDSTVALSATSKQGCKSKCNLIKRKRADTHKKIVQRLGLHVQSQGSREPFTRNSHCKPLCSSGQLHCVQIFNKSNCLSVLQHN
ncbi:hypothetical protein M758_8G052600, partial [Ceratodon purpureus]